MNRNELFLRAESCPPFVKVIVKDERVIIAEVARVYILESRLSSNTGLRLSFSMHIMLIKVRQQLKSSSE